MIWRRTLRDSVYAAQIDVVIDALDVFHAWLDRRFPKDASDLDWSPTIAGRTIEHTGATETNWILWLPPGATLDTIVHESLHLCARVLADRNLDLTDETEEAYAYYLESLCRQVRQAVTDAAAARRAQRQQARKKTRRRRR